MSVVRISNKWVIKSDGVVKVVDVPVDYSGEAVEVACVDGCYVVMGIVSGKWHAIADGAPLRGESVSSFSFFFEIIIDVCCK